MVIEPNATNFCNFPKDTVACLVILYQVNFSWKQGDSDVRCVLSEVTDIFIWNRSDITGFVIIFLLQRRECKSTPSLLYCTILSWLCRLTSWLDTEKCNLTRWSPKSVADPGGAHGARPQGYRFFRFNIQILRNVAASGVGAPYGKSWIRHWKLFTFRESFYRCLLIMSAQPTSCAQPSVLNL